MEPAKWYQMYIAMGFTEKDKSQYHKDFFSSCVIREAIGTLLDTDAKWPKTEKINFDDKAIVGLNVNEVKWLQFDNPIDEQELETMYFKLKIYACDIKAGDELQLGR